MNLLNYNQKFLNKPIKYLFIKKLTGKKLYLKNAYRVLLTRARQGMAIYVPEGDECNKTRNPEFYDRTYNYLKSIMD